MSLITRDAVATAFASKHVGLRGLWLQEALENKKLELDKVDTATNPAHVCTKALFGKRIRELCWLARVYVHCSEEDMGDDPHEWYLSRVDFTCLNCFTQTYFASAVGHELVDLKRRARSSMEKGFL